MAWPCCSACLLLLIHRLLHKFGSQILSPYFEGNHDVYFTDDMAAVKLPDHSHDLPPREKRGALIYVADMIWTGGSVSSAPGSIPNRRVILQESDMGAGN
ncbi:hypothetical protein OIU78_011466 [Salix suchowensis]|nr:hypothetical protein OIU78_011466 [Salix suchowensis]